MKVLILQLVLLFVLCFTYATVAETQRQQQQRDAIQKCSDDAAEENLKFGAKKVDDKNRNSSSSQRTRQEYRGRTNKPADQYEIPINSKNPTPSQYNRRQQNREENTPASKPTAIAPVVNSNLNSNIPRRERTRSNYRKTATTTSTTSTTTTTTTTTTTPRPSFFENLQRNNPFNFLQQSLFDFSRQPAKVDTTKRPPKKYTPSPAPTVTAKVEKSRGYQKTSKLRSTTFMPKNEEKDDEPFKIAIPIFAPETEKKEKYVGKGRNKDKEKRATAAQLREQFVCPRESEVRFQLFPKICKEDKDCVMWNRDEICCEIFGAKSCVKGAPKPLKEDPHAPLLGLIPRKCPERPLAELWWEVQECDTDNDCWPRVCCPDGRRRYCRTAQPDMDLVPVQVQQSFNYLSEYIECTPPPPKIFDLYPQACTSTFDCFPNVCCQEAGLRHCRPPKKSILTLMANVLNVDVVRRLTQNIVIK